MTRFVHGSFTDLRVGGEELLEGQLEGKGGASTRFVARYHVVEPDERLAYVYDMYPAGRHLSVSLASVEFDDADELARVRALVAEANQQNSDRLEAVLARG